MNWLTDNSLEALADFQATEDSLLAALNEINIEAIEGSEAITYGFVKNRLEASVNQRVCKMAQWRMSPTFTGWQNALSFVFSSLPVGIANHAVSRFSAYAGTGAVLSAPFKSRPGDQAGFALAMPFSSPDYRDDLMSTGMNPKDFEINIELTYGFFITIFISIQADGQYIIHPNTLADRPNALAFGLRMQLNI